MVPIVFDIPKQMINIILNQMDGLLLIGGTIESAVVEKSTCFMGEAREEFPSSAVHAGVILVLVFIQEEVLDP